MTLARHASHDHLSARILLWQWALKPKIGPPDAADKKAYSGVGKANCHFWMERSEWELGLAGANVAARPL